MMDPIWRSWPVDTRWQMMAEYQAGKSTKQIARKYNYDVAIVRSFLYGKGLKDSEDLILPELPQSPPKPVTQRAKTKTRESKVVTGIKKRRKAFTGIQMPDPVPSNRAIVLGSEMLHVPKIKEKKEDSLILKVDIETGEISINRLHEFLGEVKQF